MTMLLEGEPKPKPCPFCGRAPLVDTWRTGFQAEGVSVRCENFACASRPSVMKNEHFTVTEVIELWNKRISQETKDEHAG